jgi:hypothetical protein
VSTICREFLQGVQIGLRIVVPAVAALLTLAVLR